jgi:hypothetical protein
LRTSCSQLDRLITLGKRDVSTSAEAFDLWSLPINGGVL